MKNNKLKNTLILCILLFSLFFIGCSNSKREPVSMESIITELKSNGYKVEVRDPTKEDLSASFFPMSSFKFIYANDSKEVSIVIYSFDTVEIAQQQAQTVSKDGTQAGNSIIDWVFPQAFFAKDNLIVTCAKASPYTKQLEKLLGKPITE